MKRLAILETYWYLAVQDGPLDNEKFDTREKARKALKKLPSNLRPGVCIMSRTVEVDP